MDLSAFIARRIETLRTRRGSEESMRRCRVTGSFLHAAALCRDLGDQGRDCETIKKLEGALRHLDGSRTGVRA